MLEPVYGEGVPEQLDRVEHDTGRRALWNAIVDAIDLVCERPDSAEAHRYALSFSGDRKAWRVPVRCRVEDEDWVLVWFPDPPDAVILYVGRWPPS